MEEREDSEQISSPTNLASPAPLLTPATRLPLSSKITNYVSFSKTRLVFIVLLAFWIISAAIVIPLWLSIVTVSTTKQLVFFLLHIYLPTGLFIVSGLYLIKAYLNYFQCTLDLCELELSSTVSQIQSKATATKPDERMQKRLGEMIRKFRDDRVKPDAFRLIKFLAKQKIITIPQASPANVVKAVGWLKTRVCKISAVSREKSSKADIEFLKATYSLVRRLPSLTGIVIQGFMVLVLIGSGIAIPTTSTLYATQNRYCVNVQENTISTLPVEDPDSKCGPELALARSKPTWESVLCLSMCVSKAFVGLKAPDTLSCQEHFQVAQCVASKGGADSGGYLYLKMERDARGYTSTNWCPTVTC